MDLTVVVASLEARQTIAACLDLIHASCRDLAYEVIVCDASTDGTAHVLRGRGDVEVVTRPPGTLAPELWSAGLARARGRFVALTTGHCLVGAAWAPALVQALAGGAAGAGGPLTIAAGTRPIDWAVFYLRYSAFLPGVLGRGRIAGELAGDNVAYRRDRLLPHAEMYDTGFWEVDVHRALRADGGWLEAVPEAACAFGRSFPFLFVARHRFAHGRHFGATRVRQGIRPAWQIVAGAPLVPFVLANRARLRVGRDGGSWRFWASLPWLIALAACWAGGEAIGAWQAGRVS